MTDAISIATQKFARAALAVLDELERRLEEIGDGVQPVFDQRDESTPTVKACDEAAAAIFAAESEYSRACLRVLTASTSGSELAIVSGATGNSVLRFAACGFRSIVGNRHSTDPRVMRLLKIADQDPDEAGCVRRKRRVLTVAPATANIAPPILPPFIPRHR